MDRNDILELLLRLTKIKSDTGTVQEQAIEKYIYNYFNELPYFREEENFGLSYIPNDPLKRGVVWGLVRGTGNDTIILINHHDVVDSNDYGTLQKYAYSPKNLKEALREIPHSQDIMKDLNDDDWLFGRGTADMKGGLAVQLYLMKKYSEVKDFVGNILFLSVPDEESLSVGMRHGTKILVHMVDKYKLNYKVLINSEPHERASDRYRIYDGSVGKTMATVYVQGKKTHIGNIFEGLNPSLILSNIVINTELNSALCDLDLSETSPPPSWSFVRDFKNCYDASIPESAGGYISFLTLNRTPKVLLEELKEICRLSFAKTVSHLKKEYRSLHPNDNVVPTYSPNVKLYEELLRDAKDIDINLTEKTLEEKFRQIREEISRGEITIPESNFIIIKALLDIAAYNIPTIVIALSPPYYPHVSSYKKAEHIEVIDQVMNTTNDLGIERVHYFMGISDLSYVGLQNDKDVVPYVAPNMPLWREDFYTVPFESMKQISIPMLIIGPWGKDIHKMTERVYIPDLVEHTPLLIEKLIESLL